MAALSYIVYNNNGKRIAACEDIADAAAIVALRGDGTTIRMATRLGRKTILWHEGQEAQPAAESYDFVADLVLSRVLAIHEHQEQDNPLFKYPQPKAEIATHSNRVKAQ